MIYSKEYSMSQNNCYCNGIYFSFSNSLKNKLNSKKFKKKKKFFFIIFFPMSMIIIMIITIYNYLYFLNIYHKFKILRIIFADIHKILYLY